MHRLRWNPLRVHALLGILPPTARSETRVRRQHGNSNLPALDDDSVSDYGRNCLTFSEISEVEHTQMRAKRYPSLRVRLVFDVHIDDGHDSGVREEYTCYRASVDQIAHIGWSLLQYDLITRGHHVASPFTNDCHQQSPRSRHCPYSTAPWLVITR